MNHMLNILMNLFVKMYKSVTITNSHYLIKEKEVCISEI